MGTINTYPFHIEFVPDLHVFDSITALIAAGLMGSESDSKVAAGVVLGSDGGEGARYASYPRPLNMSLDKSRIDRQS